MMCTRPTLALSLDTLSPAISFIHDWFDFCDTLLAAPSCVESGRRSIPSAPVTCRSESFVVVPIIRFSSFVAHFYAPFVTFAHRFLQN